MLWGFTTFSLRDIMLGVSWYAYVLNVIKIQVNLRIRYIMIFSATICNNDAVVVGTLKSNNPRSQVPQS